MVGEPASLRLVESCPVGGRTTHLLYLASTAPVLLWEK